MIKFENHEKSLINKSFNIINKIKETSSTNQKIEILKSISNKLFIDLQNPINYEKFENCFKDILILAYHPQIRFNLKPFSPNENKYLQSS